MADAAVRILGIDPGLRVTGFGVIDRHGARLAYVTSGCIKTNEAASLPARRAESVRAGTWSATPAKRAAPRAVVSVIADRTTGLWRKSAWSWRRRFLIDFPISRN